MLTPWLVVAEASLNTAERETLGDRCVATGAEMLVLSTDIDLRILPPLLASAAARALARAH